MLNGAVADARESFPESYCVVVASYTQDSVREPHLRMVDMRLLDILAMTYLCKE